MYVYRALPCCPLCRSLKVGTWGFNAPPMREYKGAHGGLRYYQCRHCQARFRSRNDSLRLELMNSGEWDQEAAAAVAQGESNTNQPSGNDPAQKGTHHV